MDTTWDGLPVAADNPRGCTIVVWRQAANAREFLILHRRHAGPADYEGDWAWTPPSGARHPGEDVAEAASRELREETGLELRCAPAELGSDEWAVYVAEAPADAQVRLDAEHDRFAWVTEKEAAERCLPATVGAAVVAVARALGSTLRPRRALHISCPRCGERADFEEPFEFTHEPPTTTSPVRRWGSWYVVERFPSVFPWTPPTRSDQGLRVWPRELFLVWVDEPEGVVRCPQCRIVARHRLAWPEDAYYRWTFRGETLWAWCEEHARAIRDFVRGSSRNARESVAWGRALDHLPKRFLSAKIRSEIVRELDRALRE